MESSQRMKKFTARGPNPVIHRYRNAIPGSDIGKFGLILARHIFHLLGVERVHLQRISDIYFMQSLAGTSYAEISRQ